MNFFVMSFYRKTTMSPIPGERERTFFPSNFNPVPSSIFDTVLAVVGSVAVCRISCRVGIFVDVFHILNLKFVSSQLQTKFLCCIGNACCCIYKLFVQQNQAPTAGAAVPSIMRFVLPQILKLRTTST